MTEHTVTISTVFPIVRSAKFGNIDERTVGLESLLHPEPNSLEAIAYKYTFPAWAEKGRFTRSKIETHLKDAARAINRKFGQKWAEGAIELVAPAAAERLSKEFRTKADRIAATYLSILQMPVAYSAFVELHPVKGTIRKRDLETANKLGRKCGVFPFC